MHFLVVVFGFSLGIGVGFALVYLWIAYVLAKHLR